MLQISQLGQVEESPISLSGLLLINVVKNQISDMAANTYPEQSGNYSF